jgi:hypothetical protein
MKIKYKHVTTTTQVGTYEAGSEIFEGLLREVRELSKKKPEATMSPGKVKMVNRVLKDLLTFLNDEPEGKYLEVLDDDTLPQVSDAVLIMVQFETALQKFSSRYQAYVRAYDRRTWIIKELLAELEQLPEEDDQGQARVERAKRSVK